MLLIKSVHQNSLDKIDFPESNKLQLIWDGIDPACFECVRYFECGNRYASLI